MSYCRRFRFAPSTSGTMSTLRNVFVLTLLLASSAILFASPARAVDDDEQAAQLAEMAAAIAAIEPDTAKAIADQSPRFDIYGNKIAGTAQAQAPPPSPNLITATTYAFAALNSVALEDMSSGTSLLTAADQDDPSSPITPIGFEFWYDGVRQTQFAANANGLIRLGVALPGASPWVNGITNTAHHPSIAPYWDDLWTGNNGKMHYKVVGSVPNRKLVIEWNNHQIPRVATALPGAGTFQAWLFESTGVIQFVYGSGIAANAANGGYTVGLGTGATSFAAVTTASNTVSYVAANDAQTGAIPSGTSYTFTPNTPSAPGALSFTAVALNTMTLNWADTNANEFGYAIYRSADGVNYEFVRLTAADAISSVETGLASNTSWSWRVLAVTEGGVSAASTGSQATTTGTLSGTRTVGPTGNYATLTAAVTDIITNGLAGNLLLELQAAYTSGAETFPLAIGPVGSPSNTVTIRPETGATALSITSANATATLDLNGATNVTIDGRAGGAGASQLTIANTVTTGVAVRFINGALRNTIQFTTIQGVTTSTTAGVVLFSTSAGVTGNNRNTIDSCDVTNGATTPTNGIASIGTAATNLLNTGNTISNNNISNFFSAGSATTGILLTINTNISNTGWTISNNRLFQTATRTYTTTNTHRGIFVNGGNDYTISGNVVGFAAANGTGTYTMNGTVASALTGIQLQGGCGTNHIQGNTVAGISLTTSTGTLAGISVVGGSAEIGTTTGNTVGSPTGNGSLTSTSTTNGAFILGLNFSGSNAGVANIANNTIGSLTSTGSPATINPNINVVQILGGLATFTNNLLGSNSTADSIQTTTAGTSGTAQQLIAMLTGTTMPLTISGNTVANLTNAGTGTAHVIRGIQFQTPGVSTTASAGMVSIVSNNVHDITGSNANTAAGATNGILVTTGTGGAPFGGLIEQNTVNTIRANNAGAVATGVVGVVLTGNSSTIGVTGGAVSRNRIYDIRNASTGAVATTPPIAAGILVQTATTSAQVSNNMVSVGDSQTTNTEFIGVWNNFAMTGTLGISFNSVHIAGTAGAGALPTFGFLRGSNAAASAITTPVNIKDNILNNTRTGGTGKHYAIGNVNNVPATGWGAGASDFDVLNSAVAGTVGIWGLAADQDFANWKTASASDGSSLSGVNVPFLAPATADLHVNFGLTPTGLESGGTAVAGITIDFDNQVRPGPAGSVNGGATAPDIGADEFDGVPQDITPPSISYTPLANTSLTANRTVNATITDSNGVAGGALAPRIYYRKNAGAYFSTQCAAPAGNVYPCTIDYTLVGGAATNDVIDYFVVAQDTTGNVAANPGGGFTATDVNNVTTPPTIPNTYTIVPGFGGGDPSVTLCASGCDFTSLTNTGGIFEAMNNSVLNGNFEIEITGNLSGELGTVALNQQIEEGGGAGTYTVTMSPSGGAWTITGSSAAGLITLNAADRVTIDGSQSAGTDRSLTIVNTNAGTASAVVWVRSSGSNGATDNTVKNIIVMGNTNTTTFLGIGTGGTAIASLGTDNDNTRIENNDVRRVQFGIAVQGASAANKNSGTVVTKNVMTASGADSIGKGGIIASFEDGIEVTQNSIDNIVSAGANDVLGISLGGLISFTNTTATGGSEVTNATVTRNSIGIVRQTNTFSSAGILVTPTTSGTNLIANNFISGVLANGTSPDFGVGIFVIDSGTDSETQVYANSISMTGALTGATQGQFALAVNGVNPTIDIQDNILFNTQTTGAANISYAIGLGYATFTNLTSDFNDLFVTATGNFRIGRTNGLSPTTGTDAATLANWQAATGTDASSLSVDPLFVSTSNLHLLGASPVRTAGTPLAEVTVDIDGDLRDATSPSIGADEVLATDVSITKTDGVLTAVPGGSVTYTITASNDGSNATAATVTDNFPAGITGCSTTCVGSGGTCTPGPVVGNISDSITLTAGGSVTYTAVCNISSAATGNLVNTATVALTGTVADSDLSNNSATDTDTLSPQADLSITKSDGVLTATAGETVTYTIVASNAGPSDAPGTTVADDFVAALSCSTTCVGSLGGTCTPGPVFTDINDNVGLPAGASVTYTAVCDIDGGAVGSLVNTATVTEAGTVTDPTPGNNSATDIDTLTQEADLSITKDDGVTVVAAGSDTTYTITATNAGPSAAPAAAVFDNFPAACTSVDWTCSGSNGGTCVAAGTGAINQSVNLPSGASVTFLAVCSIDPDATGTLTNTAFIGLGVNDPDASNNSSTDVDSIGAVEIFSDGFESGDTSAWSDTVPFAEFEVFAWVDADQASSEATFGYDLASVRPGRSLDATAIVQLASAGGETVARLVARRVDASSPLELRLEVVGGAQSAWVVADLQTQSIRIAWATANGTSLGSIAGAFDGVLTIWVDGFDPAGAPVVVKLLRERIAE